MTLLRETLRSEERGRSAGFDGRLPTDPGFGVPPGIPRTDDDRNDGRPTIGLRDPTNVSGQATPRRTAAATPENFRSVRREAEKITFSEFPTLAGLTQWKMTVTYCVAVASGAADASQVTKWLNVAFSPQVVLDDLRDSSPYWSLDMKIAQGSPQ